MGVTRRSAICATTMAVAVALATVAPASAAPSLAPGAGATSAQGTYTRVDGKALRHVCAPATRDQATCNSLVTVDAAGRTLSPATGPTGWGAADIQSAYRADTGGGSGQTIAIVDAFDDPNAEADLNVYRTTYGLGSCTTADGCFEKLNQSGLSTPLPKSGAGTGWPAEIALDLQMASAVCPRCHIVLVEANSAGWFDMFDAADVAAEHGTVVSNSYGGGEYSFLITSGHTHYDHPGVVEVASSGDNGYAGGPQLPAAFTTVTGVGGTVLSRDVSTRGFSERVWAGAGSGCSGFVSKPNYQHDTGCTTRTIADVAAVASNVSVYDSLGSGGWVNLSGTSVAAPIIAGMYALAADTTSYTDPTRLYQHSDALFDVTTGSTGTCGTYLCQGNVGYDGPTGLGTPNGTSAFRGGNAALVLDGEAGDPVVGPHHLSLAGVGVTGDRRSIQFAYSGGDGVWSGAFAPPSGTTFTRRQYDHTQQVPDNTHAAADVRGNGQACISTGTVVIDDISFDGSGTIAGIAMRWELQCAGSPAVGRGSLTWNTNVIEPQHDITPRSVAMGTLLPRAVTAPQVLLVANAGAKPLRIGHVSSSDPQLVIGIDVCSGATLAVGASCALAYTLEPDGSSPTYSGTLTIPDTAANLPTGGMRVHIGASVITHRPGDRFTSINKVGSNSLGAGTPLVGDFNGDGTDDVLWYAPGAAPDRLEISDPTHPGVTASTVPLRINGLYIPLVGDFNGDGATDVLWYAPGPAADSMWYGNGDGTFHSSATRINGVYAPVVGDFDGDGHIDDILWRGPGRAPDVMWFGSARGPRSVTVSVNGAYDRVVPGDFNGDGATDLLFWSATTTTHPVWMSGGGSFSTHAMRSPAAGAEPIVLRIDSDARSDVLWYGRGAIRDGYTTAAEGFARMHALSISGDYVPLAANFDGDAAGYSDILWRHRGARGADAFWAGSPSGLVSHSYANTHFDASVVQAVVGHFNGGDTAADVLFDNHGKATFFYGYS